MAASENLVLSNVETNHSVPDPEVGEDGLSYSDESNKPPGCFSKLSFLAGAFGAARGFSKKPKPSGFS